jgi:hypothetical protein
MNIEQRLTNKLVGSSGRGDFALAAGPQQLAPPSEAREWDLSKAVFVTLISVGYGCAALAFWFMFSAIHPL